MTHDAISRRVAAFSAFFVSIVLLACLFVTTPAAAAPSSSARSAHQTESMEQEAGPVIVIGFSGVMWRDVTPEHAPNLYEFLSGVSGANIVVRTVGETTCPTEGWLTLSAGQRAVDSAKDCRMLQSPTPVSGSENTAGPAPDLSADSDYSVAHWDLYKDVNRTSPFRARVGLLGSQLEHAELAAIGPGAAMALADSEGIFVGAYADVPPLPGSVEGSSVGSSDGGLSAAAQAYSQLGASRDLVVVDLGSVRYPQDQLQRDLSDATSSPSDSALDKFFAAFRSPQAAPEQIQPQLAALDARFGELLTSIEETTPDAQILVLSVGDAQNSAPQLGFFALGGSQTAQLATSDATRQWGLVQLTDIFPTVLGEVAPDSPVLDDVVGSPVRVLRAAPGENDVDELVTRLSDDQIRSELVRPLVGPFYVALFVLLAVVLFVGWRAVRKVPGAPTARWLPGLAAWTASLPVASLLVNLLPWWRGNIPALALFGGTAAIAGMLACAALLVPRRDSSTGPAAVVACVTAVTLLLDIVLDSHLVRYPLQVASLVGTQPQVGGRFYGLSNATFAMMTAGLLIGVACLSKVMVDRGRMWLASLLIAVVGIVAVVVDGSAGLGADFGGPPALVVGFSLLLLLTWRVRLTPLRILGVVLAAGATSVIFASLDYMRPPQSRSHLGRFIQTILDGGGFEVITRKLSQSFFGLEWWLVLIIFAVAIAGGIWWWHRYSDGPQAEIRTIAGAAWRHTPLLRYTVISISAALIIGMIINDSGVVVPALGYAVASPLWLIMIVREARCSSVE